MKTFTPSEITHELRRLIGTRRVVAIIDEKVDRLHGTLFPFEKIVIEATEERKTLATAEEIVHQLLHLHADRDTLLLGIGGGITTDLCGFVAAIYKRGVPFGFIPTTLLAMVDAAIGGKNGVNVLNFKNMIGTIRQPEFVLTCPNLLRTLPPKEFRNGVAEMLKTFIISGQNFWESGSFFAENELDTIFCTEAKMAQLCHFITESRAVKERIVKEDEQEQGLRRLLNLGHTFAHALEHCAKISHGEAVSIGIVCAAKNGHCKDIDLIVNTLKQCNLPTEIPADIDKQMLLEAISQDKKIAEGRCNLIVIHAIGDVRIIPTAPGAILC